jgi:hypothetical protein
MGSPVSTKVVAGMDSGGIDQVIHPQITEHLPIGYGTDILPSLLDLIPSGIRHCITMSCGGEGRHPGGPSDCLGWIIAEG